MSSQPSSSCEKSGLAERRGRQRPRILFVCERPADQMPPYMVGDRRILSGLGEVTFVDASPHIRWRRGFGPGGWLPTRDVIRRVRGADLVFQWFAFPAAYLVAARLLGRPSLVVAGGYDVARVDAIGYGLALDLRTRLQVRLGLSLATLVLSVSEWTRGEVLQIAPRARVSVCYHGLAIDDFAPREKRERQVVNIGALSREYVERKGISTFARTSRLCPDVRFLQVGRWVDEGVVAEMRRLGGINLKLLGELPREQLRALLAESSVYAQLSLHEGFGLAVAEAMASGCTPVTSRHGALPELVGACGYYAETGAPGAAAAAIAEAFARPRGGEARERIYRKFSLERRAAAIRAAVMQRLGPGLD